MIRPFYYTYFINSIALCEENMRIKVNEIGRSMVEMLGVLAIIGVLSVAGIGTYQYALTAYQAGKIQDVLGKAKTLAQTDSRASHALEVNRFIKSFKI